MSVSVLGFVCGYGMCFVTGIKRPDIYMNMNACAPRLRVEGSSWPPKSVLKNQVLLALGKGPIVTGDHAFSSGPAF